MIRTHDFVLELDTLNGGPKDNPFSEFLTRLDKNERVVSVLVLDRNNFMVHFMVITREKD